MKLPTGVVWKSRRKGKAGVSHAFIAQAKISACGMFSFPAEFLRHEDSKNRRCSRCVRIVGAVPSPWRSLDTAPRNETDRVLLLQAPVEDIPLNVRWTGMSLQGYRVTIGRFANDGVTHWVNDGLQYVYPVAWMPLPKVPE